MLGTAIRIIGGLIKIVGNTTGVPIGNVLDALKVNLRNSAGDELGTPSDPIYVEFPDNANRLQVNTYAEITTLSSGIETQIVSYTVPLATEAVLEKAVVSGENIAQYFLKVNSVIVDTQRTYFGGALNAEFNFLSKGSLGYNLNPGDVVSVTVIHNRPTTADFEARIQTVEIN